MTYLALGDSYTIGEGVPLDGNFPYQTMQLLREAGQAVAAPEIVARTGWTTDELARALSGVRLLPRYDVVSLLIGVNNQYRGRGLEEYALQFDELLREAMRLGASVFVLSIPDWGLSPFARQLPDPTGTRIADIAREIDAFNDRARAICGLHGVPFIDITMHGRGLGSDPSLFTADGLHPAAGHYRFWAERLAGAIRRAMEEGGDVCF
jgi:lysophospholipase L1-like esterase